VEERRRGGGRKKREGRKVALETCYVISAVLNIGKSPVMSKYFVWSLRV
jgi:hypothetical protein